MKKVSKFALSCLVASALSVTAFSAMSAMAQDTYTVYGDAVGNPVGTAYRSCAGRLTTTGTVTTIVLEVTHTPC